MTKFCCQDFPSKKSGNFILFYNSRNNDVIMDYYPPWRQYSTIHSEETGSYIQYCPWCGAKLPKELSDEWYDILKKEYNIADPVVEDREKVLAEFWTDAWWKKRGL